MTSATERRRHDDPTGNLPAWFPDTETKFMLSATTLEITVRPARSEDAAAVAAIGRVAIPQTYGDLIANPDVMRSIVEQSYALDAIESCIARCTSDDDAHFLVAERDRLVVGFLHYDCTGPEPELHRLYVEPDLKRQAIGSALVQELHRRLPPRASYVLMVVAANYPAVSFYERHGLVEEAHVDGLAYMHEHIGVEFPPGSAPVPALILRFTKH